MADLQEEAKWEDSIYQIKRGDDVSGGRNGVANIQARQLANRTASLKNDVDKLNTSVMSDAKIYDSVDEAQAAINAGTETRRLFSVNSQITDYWVEQYENVNGIATPTGKKIVTAAFVEAVELLASTTDKRTRGLLTMPRTRKPVDFVSRQGASMFSINENGEKEMPGKTFSDYMNILRELIIGPSALRRARPGYLFNLVTGGKHLLAARDDGNATLEYRGIPLETHMGLLENTFGGFGDSLTANGIVQASVYNAKSWHLWASMFSQGRLRYVGQWATGGYTTADMIRVHLQPAIAAKPRFIVFLGGRNDVIQKNSSGQFLFSVDTIKNNIRYILTQLRKNGIIPIVCSMAAQNNANAQLKNRENAVNSFTRAFAISQGFPFVDMRAATVDPVTDGWKAGYNGTLDNGLPDPSHPTALGAFHMGKALAAAMFPLAMPVYPQLAIANPVTEGGPNSIINPLFLDTNNGLPTGWQVEGGNVVLVNDPAVVGNVLAVKGSAGVRAVVSQIVPITPGEKRNFSFKVKIISEASGSIGCFLETNDAKKANVIGLRPWNQSSDGFLTYSYDLVAPQNVTELKLSIVANNAEIHVGQMGLLKQEAV